MRAISFNPNGFCSNKNKVNNWNVCALRAPTRNAWDFPFRISFISEIPLALKTFIWRRKQKCVNFSAPKCWTVVFCMNPFEFASEWLLMRVHNFIEFQFGGSLSFHFFQRISFSHIVGFLKCMLRDKQVANVMFDRHFFLFKSQRPTFHSDIDLNIFLLSILLSKLCTPGVKTQTQCHWIH